MRADIILAPPAAQRIEYHFDVVQRSVQRQIGQPCVVSRRTLLAQRDPRAFRIVDNVVLDNPPLVPVRRDHADLFGGRSAPLRGGLTELEAADREIVHPRSRRIEAGMPHRYLHQLLIGIEFMEIRPDGRIAVIDLAAPHISRTFGVENTVIRLRMHDLFVRELFIEGLPVEKDLADVVNASVIVEPVAAQQLLVRIVIAEKRIRNHHFPDTVLGFSPARDDLRAFDLDFLSGCGPVNDPVIVVRTSAKRIHPFAVGTGMHRNHIPRPCVIHGAVYRPERSFRRSRIVVVALDGNMVLPALHHTAQRQEK